MRFVIAGRDDGEGYPIFRCDACLADWHLPQSVRWDPAVMTEAAQAARDRNWLIEEYRTLCPAHSPASRGAE